MNGKIMGKDIHHTLHHLGYDTFREGQEEAIRGMDYVILAVGAQSLEELSENIENTVAEIYVIGDAKDPRKALEAIAEGAEVGRKI